MKFNETAQRLAGVVCCTALVAGLAGAVSPAAPAAAAFESKLSYFTCPPKSLPAGVKCATLTNFTIERNGNIPLPRCPQPG